MLEGGEGPGVVAGDALPFGVGADHVAGVVDEGDQREPVGVAQFDEAGSFVGCVGVDRPGPVRQGLVSEDPDRAPVEPGQDGEHRGRPAGAQLHGGIEVGEGGDHLAHVVGPAPVLGDQVGDALVPGRRRPVEGTSSPWKAR